MLLLIYFLRVQAIEKVVELVEDGELSKESLRKAKPYSSFFAKSYGITELQAVFFCISLEKNSVSSFFCAFLFSIFSISVFT